MLKPQNRTIGVITVLLMLAASPISVNYAFADTKNQDKNTLDQKEGLGVILTEKIVDGKLQMQRYVLPDDSTKEDLRRMLSTDTSGWAYVNSNVYNAGIILFDGKATKVGKNLWEISSNGVIRFGENEFDLEFNGKSNGSHVNLHGIAPDEDLSYKVIFSGKVGETSDENIFVISFVNSGNPEMGQNIKFSQIGESVNSEKLIDSNQEFKKSILVW
jgi:hypothetical protein